MTRINIFSPLFCSNAHLIVEYRELPRVPNRVVTGKHYPEVPPTFRLNKGHESFFGDKIDYLHLRHLQIKAELARRSYLFPERFSGNYPIDINDTCLEIEQRYPHLYNTWEPDSSEIITSASRVIQRLLTAGKRDFYCDNPLDTPEDIWEHIGKPIGDKYNVTDELRKVFDGIVDGLPAYLAEAEKRREEIRLKRKHKAVKETKLGELQHG